MTSVIINPGLSYSDLNVICVECSFMSDKPINIRASSLCYLDCVINPVMHDKFLRHEPPGSGYEGLKVFLQPSGSVRLLEKF